MDDLPHARSPFLKFFNRAIGWIVHPVVWFRETIVVPNQQQYPWYHEKLNRVPTIDQCYTDDAVCRWEATQQFKRDRKVDSEILSILRSRFEECVAHHEPDHVRQCKGVLDYYKRGEENWFSKYGDLGYYGDSLTCFMKQKHRMVWERRHGKIGINRKEPKNMNDYM